MLRTLSMPYSRPRRPPTRTRRLPGVMCVSHTDALPSQSLLPGVSNSQKPRSRSQVPHVVEGQLQIDLEVPSDEEGMAALRSEFIAELAEALGVAEGRTSQTIITPSPAASRSGAVSFGWRLRAVAM